MPDQTLLEVEAARAMSGRPAWRVVAACVKGGSCPRCGALTGVKCRTPHIERVWAQRARERGAAKPARVHATGAQAFIDVLVRERVPAGAVLWRRPDTEGWHWPDEWDALVPPPNTWLAAWRVLKPGGALLACGAGDVEPAAMDAAIALGFVRLATSGGIMPVWVVTDLAWLETVHAMAEAAKHEAAAAQPSALVIDAEAAVADFQRRMGQLVD